jgi:hypothetical protein
MSNNDLPEEKKETSDTSEQVSATKPQKIVNNWRKGWLWFSNWAFGLICYIATFGIPQEVLKLLPDATQNRVIAALAMIGTITRFINQTKTKVVE